MKISSKILDGSTKLSKKDEALNPDVNGKKCVSQVATYSFVDLKFKNSFFKQNNLVSLVTGKIKLWITFRCEGHQK